MKEPAHKRRAVRPEYSGPAMVLAAGGENRLRALRDLLAELQDEARDVFASSGETVDRFLCERRDEVRREFGLPV
jgi:hypothetical protein